MARWTIREILANNDHYAFSEYELCTEYHHKQKDIDIQIKELQEKNEITITHRDGLPLYKYRNEENR